jgi:hypothetical protein
LPIDIPCLLFVFIKNPIKIISFLCNDVILNNDDISSEIMITLTYDDDDDDNDE